MKIKNFIIFNMDLKTTAIRLGDYFINYKNTNEASIGLISIDLQMKSVMIFFNSNIKSLIKLKIKLNNYT